MSLSNVRNVITIVRFIFWQVILVGPSGALTFFELNIFVYVVYVFVMLNFKIGNK